jgi:hypothetical protein
MKLYISTLLISIKLVPYEYEQPLILTTICGHMSGFKIIFKNIELFVQQIEHPKRLAVEKCI